MYIYYYVFYEKIVLLWLVGCYGIGEDDVDDLLCNGVLVDLYLLVCKSIWVGIDLFSLKVLELLYFGMQLCFGDVIIVVDLINFYVWYCELCVVGCIDEVVIVFKEIEGYNYYDCWFICVLCDWLFMCVWEVGVIFIGV